MLPSPPAEMSHHFVPKRKRSDIEAEETGNRSFRLENLSDGVSHPFEPTTRLLRAHLPLSWLGAATVTNGLMPGALLRGDIAHIIAWEYAVLVARQLPNGGLVVLEKVEEACCVAYPLQPFVTEKWIQDASFGAMAPVSMQMMLHYLPSTDPILFPSNHARTPSMSSDTALRIPKNRRGAAARLSILNQTGKQEDSTPSPRLHEIPSESDVVANARENEPKPPALVHGDTATVSVQPATQGNHDEDVGEPEGEQADMLTPAYLRQRYFDFLYLSKASLAFYSKGPLSRAKARAKAEDASMKPLDLASYYRDSILPAKKMDLKYKQSVRDIIQHVVQQASSIENPQTKQKTSKRTRLGKDGLWPTEVDFIQGWFKHRDFSPTVSQEQLEAQMKDDIAALRMREAQMQMILILETLAIEAKQSEKESSLQQPIPTDPDIKLESIEQIGNLPQKTNRPSKQRNLEADLEVLADKLCIWHSIGLEDYTTSTDGAASGVNTGDGQSQSKDRLRDFCVDIVIAFYSSRLPLICRSLCKTLAGPEVFEQALKAKRIKEDSTRPLPPGAALKRRAPSRSGTLEHVLNQKGTRRSASPALNRSATLPAVPQLKKDPSDLPQRSLSRHTSLSFSNREVDLEADARVNASKKRKLDRVTSQKQELAIAIQVLKKPNRLVAGTSYMDDLEQRKIQLKQPVLIAATPKANRRRTVDEFNENGPLPPVFLEDARVPSSGVKLKAASDTIPMVRSSATKKAVLAAIHDTPSRSRNRTFDPLHPQDKLDCVSRPESRSLSVDKHVFATPSKPRQTSICNAFTTPTKDEKRSVEDKENGFQLTAVAFKTMDRAMTRSTNDTIYDSLGWDDHDEI